MVCIGRNIANCSNNPHFLPFIRALCARCASTPPLRVKDPLPCGGVLYLCILTCLNGSSLSCHGIALTVTGEADCTRHSTKYPQFQLSKASKVRVRGLNADNSGDPLKLSEASTKTTPRRTGQV